MSVAKQDEIPSYIGKVEEFKKEGNTHFQKVGKSVDIDT